MRKAVSSFPGFHLDRIQPRLRPASPPPLRAVLCRACSAPIHWWTHYPFSCYRPLGASGSYGFPGVSAGEPMVLPAGKEARTSRSVRQTSSRADGVNRKKTGARSPCLPDFRASIVHPRPAKVLIIGFLNRGAWGSPQFFRSCFASLWCGSLVVGMLRHEF
jgi:hypothetical protein